MIDAPDSDPRIAPADQSGLAAKRVITGVVGGIAAAALALSDGASWSVAALWASDVAALVFVTWVWTTVASAGGVKLVMPRAFACRREAGVVRGEPPTAST